ncbi:hypothetical protein GGU11DRAFT_750047 [Lentinula aff. detonsa]|nr:hypothetical protein GGU11DRAFT_750047 [Lentinula aff. detonsa]
MEDPMDPKYLPLLFSWAPLLMPYPFSPLPILFAFFFRPPPTFSSLPPPASPPRSSVSSLQSLSLVFFSAPRLLASPFPQPLFSLAPLPSFPPPEQRAVAPAFVGVAWQFGMM